MFLLISIPLGLVLGLLLGGRLDRLGQVRFAWAPLALAGLLVQVALFTPLGGQVAGGWEPAIYVASTAAVFLALARNLRLTGLPIAAVGALSNLAAIVANGGAMPTDSGALSAAGLSGPGTDTNSVVLANPALQPLTDIVAIPAGVPFANVFSVGDVLIGLGVAIAIAAAMRAKTATTRGAPAAGSPPRT
ncbi:MAG TPA: DUF5317 family protein [Candidatus Limnocylindrales bacterium]|nr:DUF5317 family protein [Candidatus Limnocylindrales bacterium]